MRKLLIIALALSSLAIAQTKRIPAQETDNTWSGLNIYTVSPQAPTPTADSEVATKKYVDDHTFPSAPVGLPSDPSNCGAGQFPKGVDQQGNAQECTTINTDLDWPLISTAANPATVGSIRLAYADVIAWRNALNSGDLQLAPDSNDNLAWSGAGFIATGAGAAFWEGAVGTASVASASKGRITFNSSANRPTWSYNGGAQRTFAFTDELSGGGPSFADSETPSGSINSSNTSFTLAHAPSPATSTRCYLNGIRQKYTTDYSVSSSTLTMVAAPITGDTLLCDYRY